MFCVIVCNMPGIVFSSALISIPTLTQHHKRLMSSVLVLIDVCNAAVFVLRSCWIAFVRVCCSMIAAPDMHQSPHNPSSCQPLAAVAAD
jgi:hypothetical protein